MYLPRLIDSDVIVAPYALALFVVVLPMFKGSYMRVCSFQGGALFKLVV